MNYKNINENFLLFNNNNIINNLILKLNIK